MSKRLYRRSNSSEDGHRRSGHSTSSQPPAWYLENDPILHPAPGLSVPFSQLTEDQQVAIAMRMALISTLPAFIYAGDEKDRLPECVICMCDYEPGDELRKMPMCSHIFHRACIDDWLTRSLTCPSCQQEVPVPSSTNPTTPAAVTTAGAATATTSTGARYTTAGSAGRADEGGISQRSGPSNIDLRQEAQRIKERSKVRICLPD
ncbi:unnamed protein product [Hydatigera taeniaeformis]|uniref:RING-type domain-containing protein n=1 Tax=Hydatigena taeniaeformis TaxID=6205 RepID=A0A0R3X368_HYDTA|nr:unnamed protein product [Hydatigera taeniaeformis]